MRIINYRRLRSRINQSKAMRIIYRMQGKRVLHFLHIGKTGGFGYQICFNPIPNRKPLCNLFSPPSRPVKGCAGR